MRSRGRLRRGALVAVTLASSAAVAAGALAQSINSYNMPNIGPRITPHVVPIDPRLSPRIPPKVSIKPTNNQPPADDNAAAIDNPPKKIIQSARTPGGVSLPPIPPLPLPRIGLVVDPSLPHIPDEVVIEVRRDMIQQDIDALAARHQLNRVESQEFDLTGTTLFRWKIPNPGQRSVADVKAALGNDPAVLSVQENFVYGLQQATQQVAPEQYSLAKLQIPQAHALARGNKVLVAVIDSGMDFKHPELAGVVADNFNALDTPHEADPHGTAIVGAIVANAQLQGVAPAARILAVRAFSGAAGKAQGTTFGILRGLEWSVANGARIINMSFAGPSDPAIRRALAAAHERGVILVAAVGNEGPKSPPLYPAADANVIAVTATDAKDRLFAKSNRGDYIAVAAPGVDVLVPAPNRAYQLASGTSISAAQVTGAAALVLERNPGLDPAAVRRILMETARDLGTKGPDDQFGAGLVNAYRAVLTIAAPAAETATAIPASQRE